MKRTIRLGLLLALGGLAACKKEVEKIVVQDRQYSWSEVPRLYGTQRIILNMAQDAQSIYLQNPGFLGIISPLPGSAAYRANGYVYGAYTYYPYDITTRIPMNADFTAQYFQDTIVYLRRTNDAVLANSGAYIRLKKLDPQATDVVPGTGIGRLPFGAINRNNYMLFGYTSADHSALHYVLSHVTQVPYAGTTALQADARVLTIAAPGSLPAYQAVRWITAIEDYFLINDEQRGIYKVTQDGRVKQVFGTAFTDACYKWQGIVYMVEEYNPILKSTDDGETWQRYTGTPDTFNFTTYHPIGDSLVAVKHGLINLLFTLRWQGSSYRIRELKSDGLGYGEANGLLQFGDTVYLGTTGGLYKRPLREFFESRPK